MKLTEAEIKNLKGLSGQEAEDRLKRDGYNELLSSEKRGFWKIIKDVFKEPMLALLTVCGVFYLFLGSVEEAAILLASIVFIAIITVYQENKTENALEALKSMSSPRALVVRGGAQKRIPGREVVKGDIIIVKEGDRVPADAIVLWNRNLLIDESLLTGESVSVRKTSASDLNSERARPGGDDLPIIYAGSLIVQGQGVARAAATGAGTEMGKIGKALENIEEGKTPLQKQTGEIVRIIFIIVVILCLIVVAAYVLKSGDWIKGILAGLTLAMSILPEEFPVVLTVFLALGAWRIAKKKALIRKISAVEILGASTILCVDKTGTLTENRMSVKKIFFGGEFCDIFPDKRAVLPEKFHELIEYGILASKKDPFDPMEKALEKLGRKTLGGTNHLHEKWMLAEEYPLTANMPALSHVWKNPEGDDYVIAAKGAPEAIAHLCHLGAEKEKEAIKNADDMAKEGLRVLGVAKSCFKKSKLPLSQHDFDFEFIGFIGFADPLRKAVPAAVKECHGAGIRVIMITGDYPATAQNIARQAGLKNYEKTFTGNELEKMDPLELKKKTENINVFSRLVPEQKLLLIKALKANGQVVAMTGDGVNDAPALKAADIGISMGERGTDVARESSDIVLLDDNFTTIVKAVKQGRRIYDNLKKAMAYIVSVHVPIAGLTIIAVLAGWPAIFYPAHVVFLELLIDPACSIIFESEPAEANIMKRLPRSLKKPLFSRRILIISFFQGLFSLLAVVLVYKTALGSGQGEAEARTLTFVTLVISNIFLILVNRSWTKNILASFLVPNRSLFLIIGGITALLAIILYSPYLRKIFHFGPLHSDDLAFVFAAGFLSVIWFEAIKLISAKRKTELLQD